MSIRFNAASGGSLATLLSTDIFPVMRVSNTTDYYITGAVLKNYIETGLTMTGTLACGAQSVTGTGCAFTGGTLAGMTSIDTGLLTVDNFSINLNTITMTGALTITTTANNDINLTPGGTGSVVISKADINSGSIDGTVIGGGTPAAGSFTTLITTGQSSFADGSAAAPTISNTGDLNNGLYFSAADKMTYSSGGVAQVTFEDGSIFPVTNNDIDLGDAAHEFKDIYSDGTIYCDAISYGSGGYIFPTVEAGYGTKTDVTQVSYNLSLGGNYRVDTSSNNVTITLPEISEETAGMEILITVVDSGNTLTIGSAAGDSGFSLANADDAQATGTQIAMTTTKDFVILKSSGVTDGYWAIIGGHGVDLA